MFVWRERASATVTNGGAKNSCGVRALPPEMAAPGTTSTEAPRARRLSPASELWLRRHVRHGRREMGGRGRVVGATANNGGPPKIPGLAPAPPPLQLPTTSAAYYCAAERAPHASYGPWFRRYNDEKAPVAGDQQRRRRGKHACNSKGRNVNAVRRSGVGAPMNDWPAASNDSISDLILRRRC
ncbi:hypothetical protein B296_00019737 [Ensete ventricosum]|uniref:Uncharacterized protein n=1 Tax=Ensete ventricosum TaxID=4639 RepID=A0A426YKW9_ENSVE|nr:hypothetical protein B296_00019737 [Ensete ventricosum]